MFEILNWLYQILLDEQGEDDPAAGIEGQVGDPASNGQVKDPAVGDNENGEDGKGDNQPPEKPAFGDFGDTPRTLEEATAILQKIYGEHTKLKPEFDTLKGKTTATERNLALTRQALESSGIRAIQDENGNIRLEVVNQPKQEKKVRFQDTHKALFEEKVLDAIKLLVQDELDGVFEARQQQYQESTHKQKIFDRFYDQATNLLFSHFPQLDGKWDASGKATNASFDQTFHDKVMEKVRHKYSDGKGHLVNPQGELLAALEVAQEMGITAQAVAAAKKEGFDQGKNSRKILGPVTTGNKTASAKGGGLTKEEYLKLSPEKRDAYDRERIGIK